MLNKLLLIGAAVLGAPNVVIAPATPDSCSGRFSGPGGSYLTLPVMAMRTFDGLSIPRGTKSIRVEGCFSSLWFYAFENRDPENTGYFIYGELGVHVQIIVNGHTVDFDLLPNGTIAMSGIPEFDGTVDFTGTSGVGALTSIRGTQFTFTLPIGNRSDWTSPFNVTAVMTPNDVTAIASSPNAGLYDAFARGGMSFIPVAP